MNTLDGLKRTAVNILAGLNKDSHEYLGWAQ